jgi:hypothetical protein
MTFYNLITEQLPNILSNDYMGMWSYVAIINFIYTSLLVTSPVVNQLSNAIFHRTI